MGPMGPMVKRVAGLTNDEATEVFISLFLALNMLRKESSSACGSERNRRIFDPTVAARW